MEMVIRDTGLLSAETGEVITTTQDQPINEQNNSNPPETGEVIPTTQDQPSNEHNNSNPPGGLQHENSYVLEGVRFYIPDVAEIEKPKEGLSFQGWKEAAAFYKAYGKKAGFETRKSTATKKNGITTHRYIVCSREGSTNLKNINTMETSSSARRVRKYNTKVTGCKARIKLRLKPDSEGVEIYKFTEAHNHGLVSHHNADFIRGTEQLQYSDMEVIQGLHATGIGATVAHRVQTSLKGGHHLVSGSKTDFKNHIMSLRLFVSNSDAQMIVDKFNDNVKHIPNFSFEYKTHDGELKSLFWCDDIAKSNYSLFGEVVAFDATYSTNRYSMIFVPFTGVDSHKKCVTFGAGLLHNETTESYKWLLEAFLKSHGKQPNLILTDQDPAMRSAVTSVFTESHHRLCMWHVTNKIPGKLKGEIQANQEIRSRVNKLVWNVFIDPETFETRWKEMIEDFDLGENKWLSEMYDIRYRWVPAYFLEVPMCCLMKTTSRCESSNAHFKVYSSRGNNLIEFMNSYEKALNAQRYDQRRLQHQTTSSRPSMVTQLGIELKASYIYTLTIFREVQEEIVSSLYDCSRSFFENKHGVVIHYIHHRDGRTGFVGEFKVTQDTVENTFECSCMCFRRIGYLCRHVFCVFRSQLIEDIPDLYIKDRWRADILPLTMFRIEDRYGLPLDESTKLRQQLMAITSQCADRARGNTVMLQDLVNQMMRIKDELWQQIPVEHTCVSKADIVQNLIGYTMPETVNILPPSGIKNKGSGSRKRPIGPAEVAKEKSKKPMRFCKKCQDYVSGHDARNHDKVMQQLYKKSNRKDEIIKEGVNTRSRGKTTKRYVEEEDTSKSDETQGHYSSSE